MKKLILPLLLLVAFGMLVAVESDPSEVVGYVKYPLVAGDNTIAVAMEQGFTTAAAVGVTIPGCNQVSIFTPEQYWQTTYDIGDGFEEDFSITTSTPLLVYTDTPSDFFSIGTLPTPATYSIVEGDNLVMIPLNKASLAGGDGIIQAAEVGLDMATGPVNQVSMWVPEQYWQTTYDIGDGFEEDFDTPGIGTPLLVYSASGFAWPTRSATTSYPIRNSK